MSSIPNMSGMFKSGPVFYSELFRLSYNTPVWYDVILSYDKQGKPYIRTGRNESLGKTGSYPEYKDAESCARIFIGYIPYKPVEARETIKSDIANTGIVRNIWQDVLPNLIYKAEAELCDCIMNVVQDFQETDEETRADREYASKITSYYGSRVSELLMDMRTRSGSSILTYQRKQEVENYVRGKMKFMDAGSLVVIPYLFRFGRYCIKAEVCMDRDSLRRRKTPCIGQGLISVEDIDKAEDAVMNSLVSGTVNVKQFYEALVSKLPYTFFKQNEYETFENAKILGGRENPAYLHFGYASPKSTERMEPGNVGDTANYDITLSSLHVKPAEKASGWRSPGYIITEEYDW